MAPKKPTSKVTTNAGVGKKTRSAMKKSKTSSSKHASKPNLEGLEVIQKEPTAAASKSSSKESKVVKKPSPKSSPLKDPTVTKTSPRKSYLMLPPTNPSDSEAGPFSVLEAATFHMARGLSFEQLYVQSKEFDNNSSDSDLSEKQTPQKNVKKDTNASSKLSNTTVENKVATPASRKRSRDDDSKEFSPAKKLLIKLGKGKASANVKPDTDDANKVTTTSPPTKRLKINPPAPVAATSAPAGSSNVKAKSKGGPVITKNGKVKKTPEYAVEHAFQGTSGGHGTSLERPAFASLESPWSCANLNCSTGMTWVPRDRKDPITGKGPMGRKVISQFFGRNKGPTKLIPNDVWHYFCRKDYQRSRYAAEHGTPTELATQVIGNLRDQLIRLKLWRPDALFQAQLDKGATDRLNKYYALLRQHANNEAAAVAALPAAKDPKKVKPEEAFPCALSEAFNQRFATPGNDASATYDDIEDIITWAEAEISAGNSTVFVPAEFLINPIQPGETINDVSDNFANWKIIHDDIVTFTATSAGNTTSSPAPKPTKSFKLRQTVVNDPDRTEVEESNSESEPVTPTPAPRIRHDRNDHMSIMRLLNDVAVDLGYDARRSPSSSN